jgi:hypothetical protein
MELFQVLARHHRSFLASGVSVVVHLRTKHSFCQVKRPRGTVFAGERSFEEVVQLRMSTQSRRKRIVVSLGVAKGKE